MVNSKVIKVEHLPEKVLVHCEDQSVYEGDVVIGADGVRSTVRQEMWNYMECRGMKREAHEEQNCMFSLRSFPTHASSANLVLEVMTSEYNCVFGISTATPGLTPGHSHRTFAENYSILTIVGKEGRVFWFFFKRMDRVYPASQIPKFSQNEIDDHIAPYLHKPITSEVPLSEIVKRSIVRTFVSLEEAFYKYWCVDRYVCIGDSAHKVCLPNTITVIRGNLPNMPC